MENNRFATILIELKNADLALRNKLIQNGQLAASYNEEMKELHNKNASILDAIMDKIGFPTLAKVGEEASEAAWLVMQHAIEQPHFMKKCTQLLQIEVENGNMNPINLAYLSDRIAVLEGKPQLYGTQFDWDKNGILNPNFFDDLTLVNRRRKAIGLNTLEAQTTVMRTQVAMEKQTPPIDYEKRTQELEQWRKKVGWIK